MGYRIERSAGDGWAISGITQRGQGLLMDPLLNKGSAFTADEREDFGLVGLLPPQVTTRAEQVARAYEHVQRRGDNDLERYVSLAGLQDRNETLFYQLLADRVEELIPIVYTPTVGEAAVQFSHVFRRGRGLWITPAHRGRIADVLGHARSDDVRLIVVTDNERILGLGDQGAGGMVIPIGKLSLYTLGAGIHPAYTLPISLDVGTDNPALLDDRLYVGWREPRLRGDAYDDLVEEFVEAVSTRWPHALLQWEDFKKANAFRLLDRYRHRLPCFNDDIQGTAAVVAAGVLSYCRATGTKLADQRVLLVGAGAAGVGAARLLRHAMDRAGGSGSMLLVDSRGPVTDDRQDLEAHKRPLAMTGAGLAIDRATTLLETVTLLRPTVLIGSTGQPGVFTTELLAALAANVDRPLVMALSNPTSKCEAHPRDVAAATGGRAYVATGSPFPAVAHEGRRIPVSQCNNVYVFPGVGLGAIATGAREVTDAMFAAAAETLAALVHDDDLAAGRLYPPLADLRAISRAIAHAVAAEACRTGYGAWLDGDEIEAAIDREVWDLGYPALHAA